MANLRFDLFQDEVYVFTPKGDVKELPEGVRAYGIGATRIAEELGRRLVLNIVMVGFFVGVTGIVSVGAAEKALLSSVPKGTESLNLNAFRRGFEHGRSLVGAA